MYISERPYRLAVKTIWVCAVANIVGQIRSCMAGLIRLALFLSEHQGCGNGIIFPF